MCFHRNYFKIDDKAYTGNNELVYNIFVYNIIKEVTQEEILKYISKFGDVIKVLLVDKSGTSDTNVCFINFSNPVSAANALCSWWDFKPNDFKANRMTATVCDSWEQPKAQPAEILYADTSDDDTNNETHPTLLQLNDDCLEYIFKLLKPRDQLQLAHTCQRLRNIWQMACKLHFKGFCSRYLEGMAFREIREFFELAGPSMETIALEYSQEHPDILGRYLMLIAIFCRNLKSIRCESITGDSFWLTKFLKHVSHSLTKLEITEWFLDDDCMLDIAKLPNLESLTLTKNYCLSGKHLDKLINIKHLNLCRCTHITPKNFIEMCKSLKELKSLNIKFCRELFHAQIAEMVPHCRNLENLKISIDAEYVANLPKLKSLQIKRNPVRKQLFVALAKHAHQLEDLRIVNQNWLNYEIAVLIASLAKLKVLHCSDNRLLDDECLRKFSELENLEEFNISSCEAITNEGLLFLIGKCTKLRLVNVNSCSKITLYGGAFVAEAIVVLNQRQENQKAPLLMKVGKYQSDATSIALCNTKNTSLELGKYPEEYSDDEESIDITDADYYYDTDTKYYDEHSDSSDEDMYYRY